MAAGRTVRLRIMKHETRQLLAWAALAVSVGAADARAQSLRTVDAGGGLYLNQFGDRATVREPSGLVSELSLPPGTAFRRIEPLAEGWIAAGEIAVSGMTDLFLLLDEKGERRPFAAPPNAAEGPLRAGPMPLVEDGRLAGLAWVEGERVKKSAVWASRWSGLDWSRPELVSPVGPGTQIAIDGAVLADGSWLLVWAAFDGEDDEVLWSRRTEKGWSAPARLHEANPWPDYKPALVGTRRGALAAWSSWDGESYRVRLAAFEDGRWRDLGFESPEGSVRPALTPHAGGARLLYRTVVPATWRVHELDERGAVVRSAVVERETSTPPGLAPGEGDAVGLEWPGLEIAVPQRLELEWRTDP